MCPIENVLKFIGQTRGFGVFKCSGYSYKLFQGLASWCVDALTGNVECINDVQMGTKVFDYRRWRLLLLQAILNICYL